jgi:hypothetical protein
MPSPTNQVQLTIVEDVLGELIVLEAPAAQIAIGPQLSDTEPVALGTAAAGTASSAARGDHVHAHGNLSGSSLHALASTSAAGFMSTAQFNLLAAATNNDAASTLVKRDSLGDFSAGTITANLTGTASAIADNTVTSAKIVDGSIVNADINASAAIVDTKLGTIATAGKVSNSATTADSANTASAIVARDASGNFAAGTITADLTGNADTATKLNSTRNFAVTGDITGTVSSDLTAGASITTAIAAGVVVNADINASAAIDHSKLANITAGQVLLGNASNVPTATALTGDVTVNNTGVTAISAGVIVDADVNASAAIAGTKINPNFGTQTVDTSGLASLSNLMLAFAQRGASIGIPGQPLFGVGPAVTSTTPVGIGPHDYYPIDLFSGSFM